MKSPRGKHLATAISAASLAVLTACASPTVKFESKSSATVTHDAEAFPVATTLDERLRQSCLPTTSDGSTVSGKVGSHAMVAGSGAASLPLLLADAEFADKTVHSMLSRVSKHPLLVLAPTTEAQFTEWTSSSSDGKNGETVTKPGCLPYFVLVPDLAIRPYAPDVRETIVHESVHALTLTNESAQRPRWIAEGMAEYIGEKAAPLPGHPDPSLQPKVPTDKELQTDTTGQAYDAAWQFFVFLVDKYKWKAVDGFYEEAQMTSTNLDALLQKHFGAGLSALQQQFANWYK